MTVGTTDGLRFDPYDPDFWTDPYPLYQRLRDEAPVYHNEAIGFYAVSRYEDVSAVLQDFENFSSAKGDILELIQADIEYPPGVLIFEDPPIHPVHRKILSRLFTPKRIAALEPQIREFCVNALDPLIGSKGFDVIARIGAQVPMRAIGMLLGIPESQQEAVRDAVDEALHTEEGKPMDAEQNLLDDEAFGEFIEWRSKNLGDDMISMLLQVEFEDWNGVRRNLAREEISTYVSVLAGAGNETTGRLIGWSTKLLAEHPDQRAALAADHSLIPNALEEVLRLEPPGHFMCRYTTRDTEVRGTTVPAGSIMMSIMASANRDSSRYENPDSLDVRRPDIQHMTFGGGIHYCMGNALARLEGRVVLEELLTRFPHWDVDLADAKLASTSTVRGWESLPITIP